MSIFAPQFYQLPPRTQGHANRLSRFKASKSIRKDFMRVVKSGAGWRIGFDPEAIEFQGLVGADNWAIELTQTELKDFCRLSAQLSNTMSQMESELMDEEAIACEAESNSIWMEVEGYPHAYSLRLILNTGRRVEVSWTADSVPNLIQAAQMLLVF